MLKILVKNRKLLTLSILGVEAPLTLYTKKINPALYITLYGPVRALGG